MTIRYYSMNSGNFCKAKVPHDLKKDLKRRWRYSYKMLKKMGINSFTDYVKTMYSYNA